MGSVRGAFMDWAFDEAGGAIEGTDDEGRIAFVYARLQSRDLRIAVGAA